eukprot:TRINITY_DN80612_c0_g1_i1.p2 TRINITY_DN80612_c0_g1~~TRINITY_DN80612_c0_g1_i1.p2  ORF type:complete len:165 (+),score=5.73 TRINITY_DN80612_c0_g1_i1:55-549(+)
MPWKAVGGGWPMRLGLQLAAKLLMAAFVVTYDCLSACKDGRMDEILSEFHNAHAVILQGNRVGSRGDAYTFHQSEHHMVFNFPYVAGANKHSGVAIALSRRHYSMEQVCHVHAPQDPRLQGRLAAVRVRGELFDVTYVALYLPLAFNAESHILAWQFCWVHVQN